MFNIFILQQRVSSECSRGQCCYYLLGIEQFIVRVSQFAEKKMKLLIHTAEGKTALIAFLIHLAICGWCLDGPSNESASRKFIRTIEPNNWPSSASVSAEAHTGGSDVTVRKRSADEADYKGRSLPLSATMMRVAGVGTYAAQPAGALLSSEPAVKRISLGLLLPHTTFKVREYSKAVQTAMTSLKKQDLSFLNTYRFQVSDIHTDMLKVNPSPTGRLAGSSYTAIIARTIYCIAKK